MDMARKIQYVYVAITYDSRQEVGAINVFASPETAEQYQAQHRDEEARYGGYIQIEKRRVR